MPFSHILGQDSNIAILKRSLTRGKIAHAYLFDGIEGCGKKMTALAFVEAVFCGREESCGKCPSCRKMAVSQHPDLHLVEPDGTYIKIDQIRDLQKNLAYRPFEAPKKACIIDGAERLNPAAGNALLKTLEEPPGNALIILITANAGGVLPTISSRCQHLRFPALPQEIIDSYLLRQGNPPEAARIAASLAGGSLRKGIEICREDSLSGRQPFLQRLIALTLREIAPLFSAAEELAADKEQAMKSLEILTVFMRDVLLMQGGGREIVNTDLLPLIEQEAARFSSERIMEKISSISEARQAMLRNVNPRLALEVLFMRLAGSN